MKKILLHFSTFWPVYLLVLISLLLFLTNYIPGTYLLGWDSTVPEFNIWLNLQRFIFGVWQEYRGLGTLDGMAHTANIVYWLYALLFSFFLPQNLVRYAIEFTLHLLGGIGIFFLIRGIILPQLLSLQKKSNEKIFQRLNAIAFVGALFYMLNLMTVHMFYAPLELFSLHFAILPWGIYSLIKYFQKPTLKSLFFFLVVNLLGVSQAHVPTLFISYSIAIGVILITQLFSFSLTRLKQVLLVIFVLISVNAFWGLSYGYSAISKSAEISVSKQNRLSTDGAFYSNFAWSDLKSVFTFGGFQLQYLDWNIKDQRSEPMMSSWMNLYSQPIYQYTSAFFSVMSILGVVFLGYLSFRYRTSLLSSFIFMWFIALAMLGTNIPGLSILSAFARDHIPLFYQIFRFTFTKFSLLYVCSVSILIGVFLYSVLCYKKSFFQYISLLTCSILILAILTISFPVFKGFFFYPQLKVKLPDEYQQFSQYLNSLPETERIISFPIHSLWGWTTGTTEWGYRGSGFLWQAIKQPLVDRSFDAWSKENETVFLQMNRALYSLDADQFAKTFQKFHMSQIFYDHSIFQPGNYSEALFTSEAHQFFNTIPQITLEKKFDKLEIYHIQNTYDDLKIFAPSKVISISPDYNSIYTSRDQAYIDQGEYIQADEHAIHYPFSLLQRDELSPSSLKNDVLFKDQEILFPLRLEANQKVVIPSLGQKQKTLPTVITSKVDPVSQNLVISFNFQLPSVLLSDGRVIKATQSAMLSLPWQVNQQYELHLGSATLPIDASASLEKPQTVAYINFLTDKYVDASLHFTSNSSSRTVHPQSLVIDFSKIVKSFDEQMSSLTVDQLKNAQISFSFDDVIPFKLLSGNKRSLGVKNCRDPQVGSVSSIRKDTSVEYLAKDKGLFCDTYFFPEIDTDTQYVYHLKGETKSGAGMSVLLLNPYTKRFDIYTGTRTGKFDFFAPLYPSHNYSEDNSQYFQLIFNGDSYGSEENKVEVQQSELYPLPLNWLTSIYTTPATPSENFVTQITQQSKLGTSFYTIKALVLSEEGLVVLPQSFDKGWIAFSLKSPLHLFKHLTYNGWANAWMLPAGDYEVVVLYWPQLLSFAGYGLLFATLVGFAVAYFISSRKRQ